MTSLIDKLIKIGYVDRTNAINGRRKIYIAASPKIKMTASKINAGIDSRLDKYLCELTRKELEVLDYGLSILQKPCSSCNS